MPPRSSTSFCSGSRSITGNGVSGSISVELAPSSPTTWRANSETATCIPRQMPRYGICASRATRQARILPSQPREPKPPGTSTPSTCSSSRCASSSDMPSASTQLDLDVAAVVDAGVLERLVHREVRVVELHVLADEADRDRRRRAGRSARSGRSTRRARRALRGGRASGRRGRPGPAPAARPGRGRRRRRPRSRSPPRARRRRRARSCRERRARSRRASGRRRCRDGYRCAAAR